MRWIPTYAGKIGFTAGRAFFDITRREANYIFDPNSYTFDEDVDEITPQVVIDHIYDVIEGNVPDEDDL
jgi:hypothetical protein